MWFLVKYAVSFILSLAASELLAPDTRQRRSSEDKDRNNIDQDEIPSVKLGETVPTVIGNRWVTSPNVVYWKKTKTESKDNIYRLHYLDMHLAICNGPVDSVNGFSMGKNKPVYTTPVTLTELNAANVSVCFDYTDVNGIRHETCGLTWSGNTGEIVDHNPDWCNLTTVLAPTKDPSVIDVSKPFRVLIKAEGEIKHSFDIPYEVLTVGSNSQEARLSLTNQPDGLYGIEESRHVCSGSSYSQQLGKIFPPRIIIEHVGNISTSNGATVVQPLFTFTVKIIDVFSNSTTIQTDGEGGQSSPFSRGNYFKYKFENVLVPITTNTQAVSTLTNGKISLNIPNLLGGYKKGGGLVGEMTMVNGYQADGNQECQSALLAIQDSALSSESTLLDGETTDDYKALIGLGSSKKVSYKRTLSAIILDTYMVANAASVPPIWFNVTDKPVCSYLLDIQGDFAKTDINGHANPIHVVASLLTEEKYGINLPVSMLDRDSFIDAARQVHSEGLGFSVVITKSTDTMDIINMALKHCMAVWRSDIFKGGSKIEVALLRPFSGDLGQVHTVKPLEVLSFKEKTNSDKLVNSVSVTWTETTDSDNVDRVVKLKDLNLLASNGRAVHKTYTYSGCPTEQAAKKLAEYHLNTERYPAKVVEFTEHVSSGEYLVGDFILFRDKEYVNESTLFRVSSMTLKNNRKKVIAVQDYSGFEPVAFEDITQQPNIPTAIDIYLNKGNLRGVEIVITRDMGSTVLVSGLSLSGAITQYLTISGDLLSTNDLPDGVDSVSGTLTFDYTYYSGEAITRVQGKSMSVKIHNKKVDPSLVSTFNAIAIDSTGYFNR